AVEESHDGPRVIDRSLVDGSASGHGRIVDPSAENAAIAGQQGSRQDNATRQREVFDIVKTRWSRFKDRIEALEDGRSAAFRKMQIRLMRRRPEQGPPGLGRAQTRSGVGELPPSGLRPVDFDRDAGRDRSNARIHYRRI